MSVAALGVGYFRAADAANFGFGRWAFAEFTEVYQIESDFKAKVESEFNKMIERIAEDDEAL